MMPVAELNGINIYSLPLAPSHIVRQRESISGDYCLDISLRKIELKTKKPVDVLDYKFWLEDKFAF